MAFAFGSTAYGLSSQGGYTSYVSNNFTLIQNQQGEYGRCMDREGHLFDWMRYDWDTMSKWMSWEDEFGPRMCEQWCFGSREYYQYFNGYDEKRMNDYEYYYKYFLGIEVYEEGCSCLYDYGFGHWIESYGMDTTWPDGRAPIYTTNGEEDAVCYGYTGYDSQPRDSWGSPNDNSGYSQGPDSQGSPNDYSGRDLQSSSSTHNYTSYKSNHFDLMQTEQGDYGRCVDSEGDFFDWMFYAWGDMGYWMSWEDDYGPRMCEEWCWGSREYYHYFNGYDERMNDYDYYYDYFIGFEVYEDGCSCLYDYEFGHWMESYGMYTSTWPGGRAPIYGTKNGEDDAVCYSYNGYSQGQDSQGSPNDFSGRVLQSPSASPNEAQVTAEEVQTSSIIDNSRGYLRNSPRQENNDQLEGSAHHGCVLTMGGLMCG